MFIDTAPWGWPQWAILIMLFLGFATAAGNHGKPKLDFQDKTQPEKWNAFVALGKVALWGFILTAGGFFS